MLPNLTNSTVEHLDELETAAQNMLDVLPKIEETRSWRVSRLPFVVAAKIMERIHEIGNA